MNYTKTVKVYKQGGTTITLPTVFCELLEIVPGDKLQLTLDMDEQQITVNKQAVPQEYKIIKMVTQERTLYLCTTDDKKYISIYDENIISLFKDEEKTIIINGILQDNDIKVIDVIERSKCYC